MNIRDVYFKVYWDARKKKPYAVVWGSESDTGRGMEVILVRDGKELVAGLDDVLRIVWQPTSGEPGYVNAVQENGKFYFEDLSGLFSTAGEVPAQLELQTGGRFIRSDTFTVPVVSAVGEDAILNSDQLTALQEALLSVTSLEQRFDEAITALTVDGEVITARKGFQSLNARLDAAEVDVTDMTTNKKYSLTLEIFEGEPRLRTEEII